MGAKQLVVVGDNFVSETLSTDFKRYGKVKIRQEKNISDVKNAVDFVVDCSFNRGHQNASLSYCKKYDVSKIIILNHWKIQDIPKVKTTVIQAVVYDVYGEGHPSFFRRGSGNHPDPKISYCSLIAEGIRRLHEARVAGMPNAYIPYDEDTVKYVHVSSLFDYINFMLTTISQDSVYSIYEGQKRTGAVLHSIAKAVEYEGNIVHICDGSMYTQYVKKLDIKTKSANLDSSVKRIYTYLRHNNPLFTTDLCI